MGDMERVIQEKIPLYEKVAGRIAAMIEHGTFRPGERVPSVRSLSRQFKVSVSTVMEAYGLLEDRGVVTARPQSGYYVCPRLPALPRTPEINPPMLRPTHVDTGDLALMIYHDAGNPDLVQLGAAIPDLENLPVDRLNRMLSVEARCYRLQSLAYELPAGCLRLRKQIARRMMTAGCTISPETAARGPRCPERRRVPNRPHTRRDPCPGLEDPAAAGAHPCRQGGRTGGDLRARTACPACQGIDRGPRLPGRDAPRWAHGRLAAGRTSPGEMTGGRKKARFRGLSLPLRLLSCRLPL